MIRELDSVVLTEDLPEHGLKLGDMGTVVLVHRGGEGYEVEFVTLDGETVAVATLLPSQVREISPKEIATRGLSRPSHPSDPDRVEVVTSVQRRRHWSLTVTITCCPGTFSSTLMTLQGACSPQDGLIEFKVAHRSVPPSGTSSLV